MTTKANFQWGEETDATNPLVAKKGKAKYCTLHKASSHSNEECWKQKKQQKAKAKTLVVEEENNMATEEASTSSNSIETPIIFVANQMVVNPNLVLMTKDYNASSKKALFNQNYQIKDHLILCIIDNDNVKNLVSDKLVRDLNLPTNPHSNPYRQMG